MKNERDALKHSQSRTFCNDAIDPRRRTDQLVSLTSQWEVARARAELKASRIDMEFRKGYLSIYVNLLGDFLIFEF